MANFRLNDGQAECPEQFECNEAADLDAIAVHHFGTGSILRTKEEDDVGLIESKVDQFSAVRFHLLVLQDCFLGGSINHRDDRGSILDLKLIN